MAQKTQTDNSGHKNRHATNPLILLNQTLGSNYIVENIAELFVVPSAFRVNGGEYTVLHFDIENPTSTTSRMSVVRYKKIEYSDLVWSQISSFDVLKTLPYEKYSLWVDVNGSDSNVGSQAYPFKTITAALESVNPNIHTRVFELNLGAGVWIINLNDVTILGNMVFEKLVIVGSVLTLIPNVKLVVDPNTNFLFEVQDRTTSVPISLNALVATYGKNIRFSDGTKTIPILGFVGATKVKMPVTTNFDTAGLSYISTLSTILNTVELTKIHSRTYTIEFLKVSVVQTTSTINFKCSLVESMLVTGGIVTTTADMLLDRSYLGCVGLVDDVDGTRTFTASISAMDLGGGVATVTPTYSSCLFNALFSDSGFTNYGACFSTGTGGVRLNIVQNGWVVYDNIDHIFNINDESSLSYPGAKFSLNAVASIFQTTRTPNINMYCSAINGSYGAISKDGTMFLEDEEFRNAIIIPSEFRRKQTYSGTLTNGSTVSFPINKIGNLENSKLMLKSITRGILNVIGSVTIVPHPTDAVQHVLLRDIFVTSFATDVAPTGPPFLTFEIERRLGVDYINMVSGADALGDTIYSVEMIRKL